MWGALATGLGGWCLVASGAGKLTAWSDFQGGLVAGGIVPKRLAPALSAVVPPLEVAVGLAVLALPRPHVLEAAGLLFLLFAIYQGELLARGSPADCHCYGRLRHVPPGPALAVANALLAFAAFALALGAAGTGPLLPRLLWGAVAAALYLILAGRSQPRTGLSGYPYAEVRYVERRLAGDPDRVAREFVANEMGLRLQFTYLLVPRHKALWLVLRARLRGSAASIQ